MRINKGLIRIILNQLDGIYPVRIGHQDYVVEDRQNRKEIVGHLFYLKDN